MALYSVIWATESGCESTQETRTRSHIGTHVLPPDTSAHAAVTVTRATYLCVIVTFATRTSYAEAPFFKWRRLRQLGVYIKRGILVCRSSVRRG